MNNSNGIEDKNISVKRLFTRYLQKSLQRNKNLYFQKKAEKELHEFLLEDIGDMELLTKSCDDHQGFDEKLLAALPALSQLEDEALVIALRKAGTKMRNILIWHVLDQRTLLEISEMTGESYTSVRQNYSRLLRYLKKELEEKRDD